MAGQQAVRNWHARARQLWRQGNTDQEIADSIGVDPRAVSKALHIPRLVEGDSGHGVGRSTGRTGVNQRTRSAVAASDELDCVAMMDALDRGARGSRKILRRYNRGDE